MTSPPTLESADTRSTQARASRVRLVAAFAVVYIIWGSTYLAISIAIESFPPFLMAGTRHLIAGAVLYPLLRLRGTPAPSRAHWKSCLLLGTLLLAFSNGGLSWAEQVVPTGISSLLVATVSLWMVLIEWIRPGGTRPGPRVFIGLALGFVGMFFLIGPASLGGEPVNPIGAAVLLLASLCWAIGSVFSKHMNLPRSPLIVVAMQCLVGGVVLWGLGLLFHERAAFAAHSISLRSILALAYLIVFGSWLGFTAYTYLLRAAPPGRVATYAFVNPVVALFLGWMFAGEPITPRMLVAAAIILSAVLLVISAPHKDPAHAEEIVPSAGEA